MRKKKAEKIIYINIVQANSFGFVWYKQSVNRTTIACGFSSDSHDSEMNAIKLK
jgi:hypothetical protein